MLRAKIFVIGAVCLLHLAGFLEPLNIPQKCSFTKDEFSITSGEQAFNQLKDLECPDITYTLPGYYSTDVTERRFIIYHEWRGGIAGSKMGACLKSGRANIKESIRSDYKCYIIDLK